MAGRFVGINDLDEFWGNTAGGSGGDRPEVAMTEPQAELLPPRAANAFPPVTVRDRFSQAHPVIKEAKLSNPRSALRIALVGDQSNNEPAHPVIEEVLPAIGVDIHWVSTKLVNDPEVLDSFHGVWVGPGGPYKNQAGVHIAVHHARTAGVPFLGTCDGFFSALLEYAENELGLPEVIGIAEDESRVGPLMVPLVCSIGDRRTPLKLRPDSRLAEVYGRIVGIREVLQCDYGLKPEFMAAAQQGQLRYSAWDPDGAPRALELTDHPFFMGTLFQLELSSIGDSVHPVIEHFLDSACVFAERSEPAWQGGGGR